MTDDTKAPRGLPFHNRPPAGELPPAMNKQTTRIEFARRLNRAMIEKGWNQSELARRANAHAAPGSEATMTRDKVSKYIRASSLPSPVHLDLLCKALGKTQTDLIPDWGVPEAGDPLLPPIDVRDAGDGTVWLRVNQSVKWPDALKILAILKGE